MQRSRLTVGFLSLSLLTGMGAWALAQQGAQPPAREKAPQHDEEGDEQVIEFAKAPEAVRAAAIKLAGSEKAIKKVVQEEEDHISTFEIEYTAEGAESSAVISPAGDVMEIEKGTTEAKVPAAAMAALKKAYPSATVAGSVAVTRMFYEIELKVNGETREVTVDAAGKIERHHGEADEEHDRGEGHGKDNEKGKH
jgi:hypothetical protein